MNTFIHIATNHSEFHKEQLMANSDNAQYVYVKSGEVLLSKEYYIANAAFEACMIYMSENKDFWIKMLSGTIEILNKKFK